MFTLKKIPTVSLAAASVPLIHSCLEARKEQMRRAYQKQQQ